MVVKNLPVKCPSCSAGLKVKSLHCAECETVIEGSYELPILAQLSQKDQEFILSFVKHSGSLKEMAKEMSLSYPSVRNLLDGIIENLNNLEVK